MPRDNHLALLADSHALSFCCTPYASLRSNCLLTKLLTLFFSCVIVFANVHNSPVRADLAGSSRPTRNVPLTGSGGGGKRPEIESGGCAAGPGAVSDDHMPPVFETRHCGLIIASHLICLSQMCVRGFWGGQALGAVSRPLMWDFITEGLHPAPTRSY